jgi:hypothetical protein
MSFLKNSIKLLVLMNFSTTAFSMNFFRTTTIETSDTPLALFEKYPPIITLNYLKNDNEGKKLDTSIYASPLPQSFEDLKGKTIAIPLKNKETLYPFIIKSYTLQYTPSLTNNWSSFLLCSYLGYSGISYLFPIASYITTTIVGSSIGAGLVLGGAFLYVSPNREKVIESITKTSKDYGSYLLDLGRSYVRENIKTTEKFSNILQKQNVTELLPIFSLTDSSCLYQGDIACGFLNLHYSIELTPQKK